MVDTERLVASLVAFIGERTGLSECEIQAVLDANDLFWDHHRQEFWEFMHESEDA